MGENGKLNSIPTESVHCIVCDAQTVEQFLHLGDTALANKFLTGTNYPSRNQTIR